jgi:hypothetical protein
MMIKFFKTENKIKGIVGGVFEKKKKKKKKR